MAAVCKFQVEKEQVSYDCGEIWNDTGAKRKIEGQEPVEKYSTDCGWRSDWYNDFKPVENGFTCVGTDKFTSIGYKNENVGDTIYGNVPVEHVESFSQDCGEYKIIDAGEVCDEQLRKVNGSYEVVSIDGGVNWYPTNKLIINNVIEEFCIECFKEKGIRAIGKWADFLNGDMDYLGFENRVFIPPSYYGGVPMYGVGSSHLSNMPMIIPNVHYRSNFDYMLYNQTRYQGSRSSYENQFGFGDRMGAKYTKDGEEINTEYGCTGAFTKLYFSKYATTGKTGESNIENATSLHPPITDLMGDLNYNYGGYIVTNVSRAIIDRTSNNTCCYHAYVEGDIIFSPFDLYIDEEFEGIFGDVEKGSYEWSYADVNLRDEILENNGRILSSLEPNVKYRMKLVKSEAVDYCCSDTSIFQDKLIVFGGAYSVPLFVMSMLENIYGLENTKIEGIRDECFLLCTKLKQIHFPKTLKRLGSRALAYCSGLKSITFESETPPVANSSTFLGTTCDIYVPSGSVEQYKSEWSFVSDRIKPITN